MDTPIANDVRAEPMGSPERPHGAGGGEPVGGPSRRFSAQRKLEAVRRLMRGEPLELVARELNVTTARLCAWRDRALLGAGSALKDRERDRGDGRAVNGIIPERFPAAGSRCGRRYRGAASARSRRDGRRCARRRGAAGVSYRACRRRRGAAKSDRPAAGSGIAPASRRTDRRSCRRIRPPNGDTR